MNFKMRVLKSVNYCSKIGYISSLFITKLKFTFCVIDSIKSNAHKSASLVRQKSGAGAKKKHN